jgi:hypothetical protein
MKELYKELIQFDGGIPVGHINDLHYENMQVLPIWEYISF